MAGIFVVPQEGQIGPAGCQTNTACCGGENKTMSGYGIAQFLSANLSELAD
jgi:hypothetical protein